MHDGKQNPPGRTRSSLRHPSRSIFRITSTRSYTRKNGNDRCINAVRRSLDFLPTLAKGSFNMKAKLVFLAVLTLALASAVFAQTTTTGTVEGVVTDPNGAAVPNASLTLSGPNLVRSQ